MENSKLLKSLRHLTESEIEEFRDFTNSPYFNKNKDLSSFLNLIIQENILESCALDKKQVLKKLYPSQVYQERWLPDLMYGLMNLLEAFLAEEKYKQNSFQRKINLMTKVYEKEIDPMINGIEKDIELIHSQNQFRDSNYFYESFMIHSERDFSFRQLGKISDDENLQNKADQLDLFYLAQKLKDSCEMLNRSQIVSANYGFKMLDSIIPYLFSHPEIYSNHPAINIYLNIYMMLSDDRHEFYFNELNSLIVAYEPLFSVDELRSIYGFAQNYCIRQMNTGNTSFYNSLFDIYKRTLDVGLVFGDNKNMEWDFKNYVSLGLRLKEYDWTLEMINVFKENLPESIQNNAYTYNLANYYYETGDYKKATKLLNSVEFTDIFYSLGAKSMLLKIYYNLEEEESFYALVSSFGIYIRRNKLISKDKLEIYENLIRFTKKAFLLKTKLPYQRKRDYYINVESLKQKIIDTQKVANISWLLEEMGELAVNQ